MYYDFLVKIPENTGRITVKRRGDTTYIECTYARKYIPRKKYNVPKRTTIGKQSKADLTMMQPNQNFVKFFPEIPLPDERNNSNRSSCLPIGAYLVIRKVMEEYNSANKNCQAGDIEMAEFGHPKDDKEIPVLTILLPTTHITKSRCFMKLIPEVL